MSDVASTKTILDSLARAGRNVCVCVCACLKFNFALTFYALLKSCSSVEVSILNSIQACSSAMN